VLLHYGRSVTEATEVRTVDPVVAGSSPVVLAKQKPRKDKHLRGSSFLKPPLEYHAGVQFGEDLGKS
jgi:hypothetical protein